jgi:hypothetical protein
VKTGESFAIETHDAGSDYFSVAHDKKIPGAPPGL